MTTTLRALVLLAVLPALAADLLAQQATTPRARRVLADDRYLASDALAGRFPGTPGNDSAAAYLAREMRRIGLRPGGDSGTWFQRWTLGSTSATRSARAAGATVVNVVGILPGADRRLAGQDVVVGAHFDHLGLGPFGDADNDSTERVHNGADDNASGTAAVLEVARILKASRVRPARSVVFVLFNAEEEGALGSAYYANNPAIPMDSTIAMVNVDMVGQVKERRVMALGVRSAAEWQALLDSANASLHLDIRASGDGWGPSDQASFFAKKRPVIHFFETDLPGNYHRATDDVETINADGIADVATLAADLVARLAARPGPLTFQDAPPPAPPVAGAGRRPVFGTIPDMASEPGGVLLQGVRAGSPAEAAGLQARDVLIGMGTHTIANLQEMQNALMSFHPGDTVEVRIRRGSEVLTKTVILGGR